MVRDYNLLSPQNIANPYPLYHRLREESPVHLDDFLGCWILTQHADVMAAFANGNLSSERFSESRLGGRQREELRPLFHMLSKQMVFSDHPNHTRLRALVNKAFTPREVEGMRLQIQQTVDTLIDEASESREMDIISDLAYPLPVMIISEFLGVPREAYRNIKKWSNDFASFIGDPTALQKAKAAQQSIAELTEYFRDIANQRRKHPKDDLLNALLVAEEHGDTLNEDELVANCALILFAGHETTKNLIGNGLHALLRNQDQTRELRDNPSLIVSAVEETLRYDSPTQWTGRMVKETFEFNGKKFGKGQGVILLLGAANRDPIQFHQPDQFNISRRDNRHVAFGYHRHFCVGAALARLEGQIVFETILRRLPNIQIGCTNLEWQENSAIRALKSFPVVF